nr:hypothetical protein [Tanacetum cinerariifolium]
MPTVPDPLPVVVQRVSALEKEVKELKQVDYSTIILASVRLQVPSVVDEYLGSTLGDMLQKRKIRHEDKDKDSSTGSDQGKKKRKNGKKLESFRKSSAPKESSKGRPGHLTVAAEYFFNNDLEYLKSGSKERKYTTSITKTKAAKYDLKFIKDMIPNQWSPIKKCVKDVQLDVESYQKKLNLTKPQEDFPKISTKEPYTPSFDPRKVVYEDSSNRKRLMRDDELYNFSDRILILVQDKLHYRVLNFRMGYNKVMPRRKWSSTDQRRLKIIVEMINELLWER